MWRPRKGVLQGNKTEGVFFSMLLCDRLQQDTARRDLVVRQPQIGVTVPKGR